MQSKGTVFLVGAGPGSIDLLTMKAYRLLQSADVIVYDRLVGSDIMDIIPTSCIKHYVGKQESDHTLPQNEINTLLVAYASQYKKVVRLKGGDPFVFGRGGEEVEVLVQHDVPFEIVPGISSSVAAAAYAGIPVTHRGVANNFTVMTGHTCTPNGLDSVNWDLFSHVGTLVILMGIKNRQIIAQNLILAGKSPETPVAFIENATTDSQRTCVTTLGELVTDPIEVKSPAVMIIGEVVKFHRDWQWFHPQAMREYEVEVAI